MRSYAVSWRVGGGPLCVGKLELNGALSLDGVDANGGKSTVRLPVEGLSVERDGGARTLVVTAAGAPALVLTSLDAPGTALELLERLEQTRVSVTAA